ncbi:MAG TPA: family 10 glycosylhydrolase [Candidatus Eisenbacteria bacterium]
MTRVTHLNARMPRLLTGALAILLLASLPISAQASHRPALTDGRAAWVKRDQLMSPARIQRTVDDAANAGLNVLFVQVRGLGDAWYNSDIVPKATQIEGMAFDDGTPMDPLDLLIRRAHAKGIEVHAWLNVFMVWQGDSDPKLTDHVIKRHPDWVAVDARGRPMTSYTTTELQQARTEGVFLASGNPQVRKHLCAMALEVAERYDVDGIHLDYIRNPLLETGFDKVTRAGFLAEKGVDPWKLRNAAIPLKARYGAEGLAQLEKDWKEWRADQVTRLVRDIHDGLEALDKPVTLSAAVFPNCNYAPNDVGQAWMTWCQEGLLDLVVPMMYSPKSSTVMDQFMLAQKTMPLNVVMYAGLAVYNQPLTSVVESARRLNDAGIDGICFFPYDTLAEKPGTLERLSRACFGGTEAPARRVKTATAR